MALVRCPQCGRVAEPPTCFACGYDWTASPPAEAPPPSPAAAAPVPFPAAPVGPGDIDFGNLAPGSPGGGAPRNPPPPVPPDDLGGWPGGGGEEWAVASPSEAHRRPPNAFAATPPMPPVPHTDYPDDEIVQGTPLEPPPPQPPADILQVSDPMGEVGDMFGFGVPPSPGGKVETGALDLGSFGAPEEPPPPEPPAGFEIDFGSFGPQGAPDAGPFAPAGAGDFDESTRAVVMDRLPAGAAPPLQDFVPAGAGGDDSSTVAFHFDSLPAEAIGATAGRQPPPVPQDDPDRTDSFPNPARRPDPDATEEFMRPGGSAGSVGSVGSFDEISLDGFDVPPVAGTAVPPPPPPEEPADDSFELDFDSLTAAPPPPPPSAPAARTPSPAKEDSGGFDFGDIPGIDDLPEPEPLPEDFGSIDEDLDLPEPPSLDDLGELTDDLDADLNADLDLDSSSGLDDVPPVSAVANPTVRAAIPGVTPGSVPESTAQPRTQLANIDDGILASLDGALARTGPAGAGGVDVAKAQRLSKRLEELAEEMESEGKFAEAAFLYEVQSFLEGLY